MAVFPSSTDKLETKVTWTPSIRDVDSENSTSDISSKRGVVFLHSEGEEICKEEWLQALYVQVPHDCIYTVILHYKSFKVYFTDVKWVTNILSTGIFIRGLHLHALPLVATITVSNVHPTLGDKDLCHILSSYGHVIDVKKVNCLLNSSHSSPIWNTEHRVTFEIPHDANNVYIPQKITEHSGREYKLKIKMHCIRCDTDGHNELQCPAVSVKEGSTKMCIEQLPASPSKINVPNQETINKRKYSPDTNALCESLPKHRIVSKNTARKSISSTHQKYSSLQQQNLYSEQSSSSDSNDYFLQSSKKSPAQSDCITNNLESPGENSSVNSASEYVHHRRLVDDTHYSLLLESESTSDEDTDTGGSVNSWEENIEKSLDIPCDILGPLTQSNLARFLHEVKIATDQYSIALKYTKDIHGLIRQLCMLHAIKLQIKSQDTLFIWRLRDLIKRLERGADPIPYQTLLQTYRRNNKSNVTEISCSNVPSVNHKCTKNVSDDPYSESANSSSKDNDDGNISDLSHQSSGFSTSIKMETQFSKTLKNRSSSNDESIKRDATFPLNEEQMSLFLRKVKHVREAQVVVVALKFTDDIPGLICQLDALRERKLKGKTKEGSLLAKRLNDLVMKLNKGNSHTLHSTSKKSCFYVEEFVNLKDATDPVPSSCNIPGPLDREKLLSFLLKVKFVKYDIYPIALQFTQDISGLIHQLDTLRTIKLNNRCYKNTLFIRRLTDLITKLNKGYSMAAESYIKSDHIT